MGMSLRAELQQRTQMRCVCGGVVCVVCVCVLGGTYGVCAASNVWSHSHSQFARGSNPVEAQCRS